MINLRQLDALAARGDFDGLANEALGAWRRRLPVSLRLLLTEAEHAAPVALGLALRRLSEVTHRPTAGARRMLEELLAWLAAFDDETPEPDGEHPVIIIGFGRVGQIVGRALALQGIEFTGLDRDFDRVEFVKKYGNRIFYGDPSRLEVLRAAHADKARAIVLTVDDAERSVALAEVIRRTFPEVRVIARAHNRDHAHALVEAGVEHVYRETYFTALEMARSVFDGLGYSHDDAEAAIRAFRELEALFEKGSQSR